METGFTVSEEKPTQSFEEALSELETLVDALEKGELSLEDSLKTFERGVELTRNCQASLKDAEQKVRQLSLLDEDAELEPYDGED